MLWINLQLVNWLTGILFFLILLIMVLVFFKRRKAKLRIKQLERKIKFQSALQNSLLEIKEERTLAFTRELYDNVGQILSAALMQLNMQISCQDNETEKENSLAVKKLIEKSLEEIRYISKASLSEVQNEVVFTDLLEKDLQRIEFLKNIKCDFKLIGSAPNNISIAHQVIIYRMLQEIINNILKHSQSVKIELEIKNNLQNCFISVRDYGKGFVVKGKEMSGAGLKTIKTRAKLINAKYVIDSKLGEGTLMTIDYPYL